MPEAACALLKAWVAAAGLTAAAKPYVFVLGGGGGGGGGGAVGVRAEGGRGGRRDPRLDPRLSGLGSPLGGGEFEF